jgi:hypothetical protein
MVLRGTIDASLFDAEHERRLLEHLVEHGPLVDGVTGQRTATVDGIERGGGIPILRGLVAAEFRFCRR